MIDIAMRSIAEAARFLFRLTVILWRIGVHLSVNPSARAAVLKGLAVVAVLVAIWAAISGVGSLSAWLAAGVTSGDAGALLVLGLLVVVVAGGAYWGVRRSPRLQTSLTAIRGRLRGSAAASSPSSNLLPANVAALIEWEDGTSPAATSWPDEIEFDE